MMSDQPPPSVHAPPVDFTEAAFARQKIHLNAEELRILKECNSQAFYQRGVPTGAIMAGGMYYLVKIGALTPKSSYGAMPAIVFTGLVGCLVGSISAKIMCIKKVMDLPSSTLRAQFEARRTQAAYGGLMGEPDEVYQSQLPMEVQKQYPMNSSMNMDTYQSTHSFDGFSGNDRPSSSVFDTVEPIDKLSSAPITYDELRQRNREDYYRNRSRSDLQPPPRQPVQQPEIFAEDIQPFDRDRVPQYQLD